LAPGVKRGTREKVHKRVGLNVVGAVKIDITMVSFRNPAVSGFP